MLLPLVAVEVACVAAVGFQSGRWHSCPSCRREVLQWHRGGSVLTMTASRSGRGGVGHMTASCFVFLIAPIAEMQELHDCSGCKCCLIVKSVEGVEAVASGEDAAASGRR